MLFAGMIASFGASIKMYGMAAWLWAKPMVVAGFMKGGWLAGLSILEWSAGRAYSINCIGEGLTGWYDHIWSMGSPACVGFLTSHVALIGVFLASFIVTFGIFIVWAIKKIRNDQHTKDMVNFVKEFESKKEENESPKIQNSNTYNSHYGHNSNQYSSY